MPVPVRARPCTVRSMRSTLRLIVGRIHIFGGLTLMRRPTHKAARLVVEHPGGGRDALLEPLADLVLAGRLFDHHLRCLDTNHIAVIELPRDVSGVACCMVGDLKNIDAVRALLQGLALPNPWSR